MGSIRAATRRSDWVVSLRIATVLAILAGAIVGTRLGPLALVTVTAALLICEAVIELRRAPPPPHE